MSIRPVFKKTIWAHFTELRIDLPYDPVVLFLGIYPKVRKILFRKDICSIIFTVALLIITKI